MRPLLIDEETATPHTTYGISKYAIELLASKLGKGYGIPTVCLRYTYVQGPRNSFYNAYSGICRIFALRVLHGLPPVCCENTDRRPPTAAERQFSFIMMPGVPGMEAAMRMGSNYGTISMSEMSHGPMCW